MPKDIYINTQKQKILFKKKKERRNPTERMENGRGSRGVRTTVRKLHFGNKSSKPTYS